LFHHARRPYFGRLDLKQLGIRVFGCYNAGARPGREPPATDNPQRRRTVLARPGVSFQKRKREIARKERRQAKAERREERKHEKARSGESGAPIEMLDPADVGLPQLEHLRAEKHRVPESMRERIEAGTV
jgi:hypothetical protein